MVLDLLHPSPRAKPWSIEVRGATVTTRAGAKAVEKTFPSAWEAERHAERELRRKLLAGFYAYDPAPADHGGIVFLAGFQFGTANFDLHPGGGSALVGQIHDEAKAANLVRVDFATGACETVWSIAQPHQSFLHTMRFEAGGSTAIFALNEETYRIALSTRAVTRIAGYRSMAMLDRPGVFNPHCVQPSCCARRDRWLLFDGDEVQVRTATGEVIFRRDGRHPTREVREAALSPSGRRVAVHVGSRHVVYRHPDAEGDTTNHIEVWDVDAGSLLCTLPLHGNQEPGTMAISPSDGHVLVTLWYGPNGVHVFDLAEPEREPRPLPLPLAAGTAYEVAFSPDRALLAVGGSNRVVVLVWPTGEILLDAPDRARRVERVCFSEDSRLVATGGGSAELAVRLLPR